MADVLLQLKYDKSDITNNTVQKNAVTITALVDDCQIGIYSANSTSLKFKISSDNGVTWSNIRITDNNPHDLNVLNEGESLLLCGDGNETINHGLEGCHIYSKLANGTNVGASFKISGNVLALIDDDINALIPVIESSNTSLYNCFSDMFSPFVLNNYHYYSYIKDASELIFPDIDIPSYFYAWMFNGCTPLEHAPKTIYIGRSIGRGQYACYGMFEGCRNLTDAPALPSLVSVSCYMSMFKDCKSLTTAPELPAKNLRERSGGTSCYESMFEGCTSLTTAPVLPATKLATSCYASMFKGCTSLTSSLYSLPAKDLTMRYACYESMFEGCSYFSTAPIIEAQVLESSSCNKMFKDCTGLSNITIKAERTSNNQALSLCLNDWVDNVAETGNFYQIKDVAYDIDSTSGIPVGWTKHEQEPAERVSYTVTLSPRPTDKGGVMHLGIGKTFTGAYFEGDLVTITAQPKSGYHFVDWLDASGHNVISMNAVYSFNINSDVSYSAHFAVGNPATKYYDVTVLTNGATGCTVTGSGNYLETSNVEITATAAEGYSFLEWVNNDGTTFSHNATETITVTGNVTYTAIFITAQEAVYYHKYFTIESLEDNATFTIDNIPYRTYSIDIKINDENWQTINTASMPKNISVNEGDTVCFRNFIGWTMPEYQPVDGGCIQIYGDKPYITYGNIASIYPSHDDTDNMTDTYYSGINMYKMNETFEGAAGRWLKFENYANLFAVNNNQLTDASNLILPFTKLCECAYSAMFAACILLTAAPKLPATQLHKWCYGLMFAHCTSLTTAPALPIEKVVERCYYGMFMNCTSLTTAPFLPATQSYNIDSSGKLTPWSYKQWTSTENNAPGCYGLMFYNCRSLNYIKCLYYPFYYEYDGGSTQEWFGPWVLNVAPNGTFVKSPSAHWPIGNGGIPEGWTVVNDGEET